MLKVAVGSNFLYCFTPPVSFQIFLTGLKLFFFLPGSLGLDLLYFILVISDSIIIRFTIDNLCSYSHSVTCGNVFKKSALFPIVVRLVRQVLPSSSSESSGCSGSLSITYCEKKSQVEAFRKHGSIR